MAKRPKIRRQGIVVNNMSRRNTRNVKHYGGYRPVGNIDYTKQPKWWKEMSDDGVMMTCTDSGDCGPDGDCCYDEIADPESYA